MAIALNQPVPSIYDPSGAIRPEKLHGLLGLKSSDLAKAIGVSPSTISRGALSPKAQAALREIFGLYLRALRLFGDNQTSTRVWLHAPNPDLDFKRPIDYVLEHRPEILGRFLANIEDGVPS